MNLPLEARPQHTRRLRVAAGLIALGMVAAACGDSTGGGNSADGSAQVTVGYYPGALVSLPALVADAQGFYEQNGLDASLVQVSNGPGMTSGLASGSLDFANNSYDNLAVAADKELPVKAVVGNTVRVPFKLIVHQDVPMPHAAAGYPDVIEDLVGLKWGVIALGVSLQYLDEALLTSAGYSADDATFVAVGLGDSARAALENRTVDTYLATEPLPAIAEATGEAAVAVDLFAGQGPAEFANLDYNGWWASDDLIESDPETVQRFIKANQDAYCWYREPTNFDALVQIIKQEVPVPALNDEQYAAMVKNSLPSFGVTITDDSLATWQELLQEAGQIQTVRDREALLMDDALSSFTCP